MRKIETDDLWSAFRGLGMARKSKAELEALVEQHAAAEMFAGKVIAEAARQAIAGKLYSKES